MRWLGNAWVVFVCALAAAFAHAEEPVATRLTPDVRVFPQFFSIAQDDARQVYLGGIDGIVRDDGGRWIWEPSPKRGPVRALQVGSGGRVWYGGHDSFGYLETLSTGEQRYVDLAPQFTGDLHGQAFSDVWSIAEFHGVVWFAALRDLFAVDAHGKRIGYWHRDQRIGDVVVVGGEVWVQWRGEGLRRWNGHDFVPVPGTQMFGGSPIYGIYQLADGSVLVHDIASGLAIWRDGVATKLDDPALRDDVPHLTRGTALGGGRIAFAGDDGRLRVLDLAQRRFETVPVGSGFMASVMVDRDGQLLAVDNQGAVRLPWPPRWTRYGSVDGISGSLHDVALVDGRLFLCSGAGVQETVVVDGAPALPLRYRPWVSNECWTMQRVGDALLLAESLSLYRIDGERATAVSANDLYPRVLLPDPLDPARLWVGTEQGPALLQRDGAGFRELGRVQAPGWRASTIAAAAAGEWVGSEDRGLFLARADAKVPHGFTLEAWGARQGLELDDSGAAYVSALPEGVFVSTGRGLFRFDRGRFVRDDDGGLRSLLGDGETVRLRAAGNGDRWAFSYRTVYRRPQGGRWQVALVGGSTSGELQAVLPLAGGDALVGGDAFLAHYRHDGSAADGDGSRATVRITAVRLNREGHPPESMPLDRLPRMQPRGGSIDFDLGFTDFAAGDNKQYQVRLEGFSKGWSAWSRQSSYRFFALPPGEYVLHVRARREYDAAVEGAPFRFVIVPRWYERGWAIPLLVVLACALVAAALIQRQRLRVRHLRDHNLELDRLVRARTQDLERVNLRLQDLADRDGLTGIANRRRFDGFLEECLQRVQDRRQPLGLAMVDVDHFKRYNDGHGHQAGDDVLRRVARLLSEGVRGDTLVARYGGEEFAIVAPGCDLATMREVAERLRAQVEGACLGVTVSIGICACDPSSVEPAETLLARADAALYRAKEEGRNRVA